MVSSYKKIKRLQKKQEWANLYEYMNRVYGIDNSSSSEKIAHLRAEFHKLSSLDIDEIRRVVGMIHFAYNNLNVKTDPGWKIEYPKLKHELERLLMPFILNHVPFNDGELKTDYCNDDKVSDKIVNYLTKKAEEDAWGDIKSRTNAAVKTYIMTTIKSRKKDAVKATWAEYILNEDSLNCMKENDVPPDVIDALPVYKRGKFQSWGEFEKGILKNISYEEYIKYSEDIARCIKKIVAGYVRHNANSQDEDEHSQDLIENYFDKQSPIKEVERHHIIEDLKKIIDRMPTESKKKIKQKIVFLRRLGLAPKDDEEYLEEIPFNKIAKEKEIDLSESRTSQLFRDAKNFVAKELIKEGYGGEWIIKDLMN